MSVTIQMNRSSTMSEPNIPRLRPVMNVISSGHITASDAIHSGKLIQ